MIAQFRITDVVINLDNNGATFGILGLSFLFTWRTIWRLKIRDVIITDFV